MLNSVQVDHTALVSILQQMQADLFDREIHYVINAGYAEVNSRKQYFTQLHINQDRTVDLQIKPNGVICQTQHNKRVGLTEVYVPYQQIWQVSRNDEPLFTNDNLVYFNAAVMMAMFDYLILGIPMAAENVPAGMVLSQN